MLYYLPEMGDFLMEIKDSFVTNDRIFPKVREIAFTRSNIFGNLGTLMNETDREVNDNFGPSRMQINDEGVYIYKSKYDNSKALRIYKCFNDPNFNGFRDEQLISKLQYFQPLVDKTSFPTGVVTLDGKIIGQEIDYYDNYKQLYEIKDLVTTKELLLLYRKCLEIVSELHNKGIGYLDIHGRNFLVDNNLDVKLIDFEPDLVKFDDNHALNVSLNNFYRMINLINERINLNASYIKPTSIEEAKKNLEKLEKKVR